MENKYHFNSSRLIIRSWKETKNQKSEKRLAKRVIEILSPNVTKALPSGWQNINSIESAKQWIKERDAESHFLCINQQANGETIGFIFLYEPDKQGGKQQIRFGYLFAEKAWGNGFATELIKALVEHCKKGGDISSISGGVERNNLASIRVLEKVGFSVCSKDASSDQVVFYEYVFKH